jgi:hypothetical protein
VYENVLMPQEKFDIDLMKNPENDNPARTPWNKSECDRWDIGGCIYILKAGR